MAIYAVAVSAAQCSFDMMVEDVVISRFFEVDDASPNCVGGGTTTGSDLLDCSFSFTRGALSFTGTPATLSVIRSFDMTYSSDLSTVVSYDISLSFVEGVRLAIFDGNSVGPGWARIEDPIFDDFSASTEPAPTLSANLIVDPQVVPLPAGLPLLVGAMGSLAFAARRRRA